MTGQIIKTIAKKEIKYLLRERTFFLVLGIFVLMAILSTYIGWAALHTVKNVYDAAAEILMASGQAVPDFPLSNVSSLAIVKNMIIYVVLIGSLLAIILGYFIGVNDRMAGTVRLIFSRPVVRKDYMWGKFLAAGVVLVVIVLVAFLISLVSAGLFQVLSWINVIKMLGFYLVSLIYLLGFAWLAIALAVKMNSSARALLYSIFIWVVITFALPELSSALYPTSLLNPVLPPTTILDSSVLSHVRSVVYPFSVSEHFKGLSGMILGVMTGGDGQLVIKNALINLLVIFGWGGLAWLVAWSFFKNIKPGENDLNDLYE